MTRIQTPQPCRTRTHTHTNHQSASRKNSTHLCSTDTRKQTYSNEVQRTIPFPAHFMHSSHNPPTQTPQESLQPPIFQFLSRFTGTGYVHTNAIKKIRGSHGIKSAAVQARAWTPNCLSTTVGRQRRLKGHEQLRNKLSHRDVSSCRPLRQVLWVSLHFTAHSTRTETETCYESTGTESAQRCYDVV